LWFGDWHTKGGRVTLDACRLQNKPFMLVFGAITRPSRAAARITETGVKVLNADIRGLEEVNHLTVVRASGR
jgi:hypothetical protein